MFFKLIILLVLILTSCHENSINLGEENSRLQKAAYYNTQLGIAYLMQEDKPRAKRKLLEAIKLAPNSPEANAAMGFYFEKTGNSKEADLYYKKALAISPSGAQFNNYGAYMCRLGKYVKAQQYFQQAVEDLTYLHTAEAYENAGLCFVAVPDYDKARRNFIKALENDRERPISLYELVKIDLKQNNTKEAMLILQKYFFLTSKDPKILDLAIKIAKKEGNKKVAAYYSKQLRNLNLIAV